MKIVINANYGGYSIPTEVQNIIKCEKYSNDEDIRTNKYFVKWVELHKDETDLKVVEIPFNATDWEIDEYDGWESLIAVVDGKIVHIY